MIAKRPPRAAVVLIAWIGLGSCGGSPTQRGEGRGVLADLDRRQIEQAMLAVRTAFDGMQDVGYTTYTPTQAVEHLVSYLNASSVPLEGEPKLPSRLPEIVYVEHVATGPWQVVLVPLEREQTILVEGYAADAAEPVSTMRLKVPDYW